MQVTSDAKTAKGWRDEGVEIIPVATEGPEGMPIVVWRTETRRERRSTRHNQRKKNRRGGPPSARGIARRDKLWFARALNPAKGVASI